MALTFRQAEYFDDLLTCYREKDFIKPLSNWSEGFLSDNLHRYEEDGMDLFVTPAQWKWLRAIGEENCDLVPENYIEDANS